VAARAVSPEALIQARKALGTAPFEALLAAANRRVSEEFDELRRFKGLRVTAVDGAHLNLPSRPDLENEFGRPRSTGQRPSLPQALLVTLDWLRLGWFYDWKLARYDAAELALARDLCARLGLGDLLLADRLFFDPHWFVQLDQRGVKYLFRATANRWLSLTKASKARIERQRRRHGGRVDLWCDLHVRDPLTGKRTGTVRVRYLEVPQTGSDTLRFFTNLDVGFLPADEAATLYFQRWGIETDFRLFKGPDHLPVVLSRKPQTVRQEILLRLLAHNAVRHVQALACLRQRRLQPHSGSPPDPSEAGTSGWRKRHLVHNRPILPVDLQTGQTAAIILGHIDSLAAARRPETPQSLDELLGEVTRYQIYAKPGRRYPRLGRKYQKGKRNKGNRRAQARRWRGKRTASQRLGAGET
jgi:hypothetical protein